MTIANVAPRRPPRHRAGRLHGWHLLEPEVEEARHHDQDDGIRHAEQRRRTPGRPRIFEPAKTAMLT